MSGSAVSSGGVPLALSSPDMTPRPERGRSTESRLGPQARPDRAGHRAAFSSHRRRILAAGRTTGRTPRTRKPAARLGQAPKPRRQPSSRVKNYKLDDELEPAKRSARRRKERGDRHAAAGRADSAEPQAVHPRRIGRLDIINGEVLELPNHVIQTARVEARDLPGPPRPADRHAQLPDVGHGRRGRPARQSLGYKGRASASR